MIFLAGKRLGMLTAISLGLVLGSGLVAAAGPTPTDGWSVDLSAIDADDVNVRYDGRALRLRSATLGPASLEQAEGSGQLVLPPHDLARPSRRVQAQIVQRARTGASAEVEVRGQMAAAQWTEWYPAGATLPASITRVQVRVVLSAVKGTQGPAVSAVRLTADPAASGTSTVQAAAALTYRVFATREGLVGGTTANGHVIKTRDHFVALPSRRGLSGKNAGDYSVRVCSPATGRCEYAPVWDVGPWNTKDDYWNPASTRQMWRDLPRGRPEAQAAFQNGYNGGKDQFGRTVRNPAGIDLADGTFWDGLKLADNAWVNVTYLWAGSGPKGLVRTSGGPVTLRSGAQLSKPVKGLAANYAKVIVECHVRGQTVTGTYGTSNLWNRIGPGHFIPDVYLNTGSDDPVAPAC